MSDTLFNNPFERFITRVSQSGWTLLATALVALLLANSPWEESLESLWLSQAYFGVGDWQLGMSLRDWINEALMAFFFLFIGLIVKREILVGDLSSPRSAGLPIIAAIGGMVVPAMVYLMFNPAEPERAGWGVSMVTDITFVVALLVLLRKQVPRQLILFLAVLAVVDNIGAVLAIVLFYNEQINFTPLGGALILMALLFTLNRGKVRFVFPYVVLGILLWWLLLQSGLHATIAGALLAFAIPVRSLFSPPEFHRTVHQLQEAFRVQAVDPHAPKDPLSNQHMADIAEAIEFTARRMQSPIQYLERYLSPWVNFFVIPLFALVNAGIDFSDIGWLDALRHPVTQGVIISLVLGKFIGVAGFAWLAVKSGLGKLPSQVSWPQLLGAAWLSGLGFTMSLFIGQLAFSDPVLLEQAKLGNLLGSGIAGSIGLIWLALCKKT